MKKQIKIISTHLFILLSSCNFEFQNKFEKKMEPLKQKICATRGELSLEDGDMRQKELHYLLPFILNNKNITALSLDSIKVGDEMCMALAETLQNNKTVMKLALRADNITDKGAIALAKALKNNNTLLELDISQNNIGNVGIKELGTILNSTILKKLDLNTNLSKHDVKQFEGIKILAEALKSNNTLESLDLSQTGIDNDQLKILAEALKTNHTLKILNLGFNYDIGDSGVRALAEALKENTTLEQLALFTANIQNEGISALVEALKNHKTIQKLFLNNNPLGDDEANKIGELLNVNQKITVDIFWNTQISQSMQKKLRAQYGQRII